MNRAALAILLAVSCDARPLLNEAETAEMQKQRLTIPLSGGIASGTDGKQLPIGKSEEMQNVRPGRIGEVTQRNGTSALGTALIGAGSSLPAPWALGTLRGALVSFSGVGDHPANLYSPTNFSWSTDSPSSVFAAIRTNRRGPILATRQQISGNGLYPDIAYANGYYFVIYTTTRNGVAMIVTTVIDTITGQEIVESTHAGAFVSWGVRVVNAKAVFVYATTALFTIETWSASNPGLGVQSTVTSAKTVASGTRLFDMLVKDGTTVSFAYSDGTNVQCFDYVPLAGAATFWTPKDSAAANIPINSALNWMQDFGTSGKIALIVLNAATTSLKVHWDIPTAGATRQAVSSYVMDAAAGAGSVSGFTRTSAATGEFTVLYDQGPAFSPPNQLKGATREAGVIATALFYRLSQDSKPFVGSDGKYYVVGALLSQTQPTRFTLRVPETLTNFSRLLGPVAKEQINSGYVGFLPASSPAGPLSPAVNPASGEFVVGSTVQLRLPGNPSTYVPPGVGIDLVHIKFKAIPDTTTGPPREAIDSLFTPGGTVGQFDGRTYCDAGFGYYPEQPGIASGGGGSLTAGATYYYALVYRWTDASGRLWRSAPSVVKSVAMGANNSNTLSCPTYTFADRDDISIEVYRGAANDTITFQLAGVVANDPTVSTVNFVDTFADTVVANGEALYTNGAVGNRPLAADGIPGSSSLTVTADRAWIVSNDNPYEVWPSNKFIPGQGWRFSEQNKLIFNDSLGPVVGVAKQPSGVVIVFKANAYYLVSGDGPNQAGNGGSFSVSQPIIGAGTDNPRSILETPSGTEFRSGAGTRAWYRVNTANATEYIGSPIERYTTVPNTTTPLPIVGAVMVPATGETRYYTSTSNNGDTKALVHDPISDTWMVDTSPVDLGAQSAAVAYDIGAAVAIGSTIYVDNAANPGQDGGSAFNVFITTPWIKGSDIDGYAMFREARGVGENAGSLVTTVTMEADFDGVTPLVSESSTTGALWDWAIKYPAKLSSFRFQVFYFASTLSPAPKVSAIIVEYGVKAGFVPASYTKRMQ